eukprot:s2450_g8.t1
MLRKIKCKCPSALTFAAHLRDCRGWDQVLVLLMLMLLFFFLLCLVVAVVREKREERSEKGEGRREKREERREEGKEKRDERGERRGESGEGRGKREEGRAKRIESRERRGNGVWDVHRQALQKGKEAAKTAKESLLFWVSRHVPPYQQPNQQNSKTRLALFRASASSRKSIIEAFLDPAD